VLDSGQRDSQREAGATEHQRIENHAFPSFTAHNPPSAHFATKGRFEPILQLFCIKAKVSFGDSDLPPIFVTLRTGVFTLDQSDYEDIPDNMQQRTTGAWTA
jgi:hypothetical protein